MTDFKRLTDTIFVAAQLSADDVKRAADEGFALIVNNRPDGEEAGQPRSSEIEKAASDQGMTYRAVPVSGGGFGMPQVEALQDALNEAEGKVLAFCRSGTRSTMLWALAQAKGGMDVDAVVNAAQGAGYDVQAIRPTLELLARQSDGA